MEMIALYDAKNRLSELCTAVHETGEPCIISRRGKPIVQLVPVVEADQPESVWDTVEESRAKYGDLDHDFEVPIRSAEQRPDPIGETDS